MPVLVRQRLEITTTADGACRQLELVDSRGDLGLYAGLGRRLHVVQLDGGHAVVLVASGEHALRSLSGWRSVWCEAGADAQPQLAHDGHLAVPHNCDFCLDRREKQGEPLCISSCPHGALSLKRDDEEFNENTYLVGDNLIVHSTHWQWEKA